ncbi:MAG: hypothetical protein IKM74_09890 [Bacteroidales bacterium]|nr:hypothetical protein [Bacteroidales bacterium]
MNKNLLKWILIATVILGAAGYLILSETSSNSKKEQIVVGHSKPFKIEPVEGITISAPKNALDKNREFKLTPVDDKTYDKVVELLETEDLTPFMVFDLDAGMKPGEFLPGDYDVVIDLNKMGIPENLQENICVYRVAKNGKKMGAYRYNTQLADGKLSFKSNQNSFVSIVINCVGDPLYLINHQVKPYWKFLAKIVASEFHTIIDYYYFDNTAFVLPVSDKSGNFVLHFRFRDTENPDGYTEFAKRREKYQKQYAKLEKQAKKDFEDRVQKELEKEHIKPYFWEDWFPGKQVRAIKEKIGYNSILKKLIKDDAVMKELNADPAAQLPKSIETIKNQIIRANRYLDSIGLHKLNKEIPFFLLEEPSVKSETYGAAASLWVDGHCVVLNYSKAKIDKESSDHTQVTLVHELFHVRQQSYYTLTKMGSAAAEATATVLERDAAKKWYKDGIITEQDPTSTNAEGKLITDRDEKHIFGYPFNTHITKLRPERIKERSIFSPLPEEYTYGDAIEGIREGVGKESVTMKPFMDSYSLHGPHMSKLGKEAEYSTDGGWIGWIKFSLGIDGEQFNKGWRYFGEKYLPVIIDSQTHYKCPEDVATKNILLKPTNPIEKIDKLSKPQDYTVNTFHLEIGKGLPSSIAHIFVVCKPKDKKHKGDNPYVSFYMSDYKFQEYVIMHHLTNVKPTLYYEGNPKTDYNGKDVNGNLVLNKKKNNGYYLGVVTTSQSKGPLCDYYAVALFKPEAPEIRKVKDDKITFIVPKPARALTKEKLITGVVVTYKDKNGEEYTREIEPKNFGKKATWTIPDCSKKGNSFTLSLQWYYKPDEQTTYVSPIGEPAQWGAKGDQPEEEVVQTKEPETNYWKQVSSRMTMKNTSIDVDQSNDDEVSSDYRSIDLQEAKTGRSLEFTGMGATEEKTKENGRVYVQDIFIEGTLTYTEPPKFWIPTQQYKAHWEIADDPYLTKVSDPFVFEAKNTSSDQAACAQSKKDKIDNGRSSVGKVNWPRGSTTTFEARHPEKNGPKSFTLTQTYSIKERQGSDLMATVTFVYNYEWVGEEEPEPELETENVPEGGYWQLVKTEVDDSKISAQGVDKNLTYNNYIEGKDGVYLVHGECGYEKYWKKPLIKVTHERTIKTERPKKIYTPGENIRLKIQYGATKITPTDEPNAKNVIHGHSVANFDYGCTDVPSYQGSFGWEQEGATYTGPGTTGTAGEDCRTRIAPTKGYGWTGNTFLIIETVRSSTGNTVELKITYHYEWVDGGKKAKPVKEKPVTGGHWKLIHTGVSTEQGMITGSAKGITIQGSNGHYTAHVERDGMISDREINFEKPKSVYMPGEEITLKVTNEKPKIKGGKEGMSYGDIVFSTGQWDGCVEYEGDWDDKPSYSNKKVVGVAKGSAPSKPGTPGAVGFFITEYIKVYGSMSKISTTYNYAWEE